MVSQTDLLLFDLGGVLVEFSGPRELGQYLRWTSTPDAILERWIQCPHTEAFERGALSPAAWAERFVEAWEVDLPAEEFLVRFTGWSRRILPGALELLARLRQRYRIAALSNSNPPHWYRNKNELRIVEQFEFAVASHEVGVCKPDPKIYRLALERGGITEPHRVVFFDDMAVNVAAARAVGMRAFQVRGVDALRDTLDRQGFL